MCVSYILVTDTFLAVKNIHYVDVCVSYILVTDTFLAVKEMHDLHREWK